MIKSIRKLHALISQNASNKVTVRGIARFKRVPMNPIGFTFPGYIIGVTDIHDHEFTTVMYSNGHIGSVVFYSKRKAAHESTEYDMTSFKMDGVPDTVSESTPMNVFIDTVGLATVYMYPFWSDNKSDDSSNVTDNILDAVYTSSILPNEIPRDKYLLIDMTEAGCVLHLTISAYDAGYDNPFKVKYTRDQKWELVESGEVIR